MKTWNSKFLFPYSIRTNTCKPPSNSLDRRRRVKYGKLTLLSYSSCLLPSIHHKSSNADTYFFFKEKRFCKKLLSKLTNIIRIVHFYAKRCVCALDINFCSTFFSWKFSFSSFIWGNNVIRFYNLHPFVYLFPGTWVTTNWRQ